MQNGLKSVFVSGSTHDYDPLGGDRIAGLCHAIGRELINEGLNLISGAGLSIGWRVASGAVCSSGSEAQVSIYPFPLQSTDSEERKRIWTQHRRNMISQAEICIFISGNKLDGTGNTIEANGVIEEFEIATELGKYPIPIGATGHASKRIWEEVNANLDKYFPGKNVGDYFATLGDSGRSNDELLDAVVCILRQIKQ